MVSTRKTGLLSVIVATALANSAPAELHGQADMVASVNGVPVTRSQFESAVYSIGRSTMYHGQPRDDDRYLVFRRTVMDRLIDRLLLLQEAERRGIRADAGRVERELQSVAARYAGTPQWQQKGAELIDTLRTQLEEDDILEQLQSRVRDIADPSDDELHAYYAANPAKFTEPGQELVSVIVLPVSPSSGADAWQSARREAGTIIDALRDGADFADLARRRSADKTAEKGGDMGYVHEGMLSASAHAAIGALGEGEISEPVTVLEGIAIFQLRERRPERLHAFSAVSDRAAGLWRREQAEQSWDALLTSLRAGAEVEVDAGYLATLPVARQ